MYLQPQSQIKSDTTTHFLSLVLLLFWVINFNDVCPREAIWLFEIQLPVYKQCLLLLTMPNARLLPLFLKLSYSRWDKTLAYIIINCQILCHWQIDLVSRLQTSRKCITSNSQSFKSLRGKITQFFHSMCISLYLQLQISRSKFLLLPHQTRYNQ